MRSLLILGTAVCLASTSPALAQEAHAHGDHGARADAATEVHGHGPADDLRAIGDVVDRLFDGMRAGDSAAVRELFHPQARMLTSFRRDGEPRVAVGDGVDRFVEAVGAPHDEVWDERIWDVMVHVDADLGMAWMDYAFFLGEDFSHCGINLFELVRTNEGWRIIGIADTRRFGDDCELPEHVRD